MLDFQLARQRQHTGTECYSVEFELREQDDLYDTRGDHVRFTFRPAHVRLAWERDLGGAWRRRTYGPRGGAQITGPRVLNNGDLSDKQTGSRDVFKSATVGGALTEYAASLPRLADLVAEEEACLPD